LPLAVVDQHKAEVWTQVFPKLVLRKDLAIHRGGAIAWAIRENSPLIKAEIDAFFSQHGAGTSFGNTIRRRYFGGTKGVKSAASAAEIAKFRELLETFRRYGSNYAFEPLMLAAQGFQESGLDQSRRSPRGAVGIMQLLPKTASAPPISLAGVERDAEINIHAGAKYMRHLRDAYVSDPALSERNRTLLTFAAYNAGPGNLRKFRRRAAEMGLDPNIWFNNVEQAAANIVGRETVQYVSNIYKYFIAYEMAAEQLVNIESGKRQGVQ
jgi:membrane-bound lytic murein transglycosylase MltF